MASTAAGTVARSQAVFRFVTGLSPQLVLLGASLRRAVAERRFRRRGGTSVEAGHAASMQRDATP
jgi:hypothetical protein